MMFSEIKGQDSCINHLQRAIKEGQVSHAYIICGEKGTPKREISQAFAAALVGEKAITNNPDIIYISSEGKAAIPIKDIREKLTDTVTIRPFSAPKKIYIIDGADRISIQAQNALLKTLEEPPEYVVIILLAESLDALLPTVKSRCIQIFTRPNSIGEIVNSAEFRDLKNLVEELVLSTFVTKQCSIPEAIQKVIEAAENKENAYKILDLLELWFTDVLLCKSTGFLREENFPESKNTINRLSTDMDYSGINKIIVNIQEAKYQLKYNVNTELVFQTIFIKIKENS